MLTIQNITRLGDDATLGLIPEKAFRALMMVDFWNPVYSWRRGVLMQYLPQKTNYDGEKQYDLESSFTAAIRKSHYVNAANKDSPESNFLEL